MSRHHNPNPKVDFLLYREDVLLVIWRNDPFKGYLSLPCGIKYDKQKVEKAVKREAKEELTLEVEPIKILDVFSEPLRSNGDILTILIQSKFNGIKVEQNRVGFDHFTTLCDCGRWKYSRATFWSSKWRITELAWCTYSKWAKTKEDVSHGSKVMLVILGTISKFSNSSF